MNGFQVVCKLISLSKLACQFAKRFRNNGKNVHTSNIISHRQASSLSSDIVSYRQTSSVTIKHPQLSSNILSYCQTSSLLSDVVSYHQTSSITIKHPQLSSNILSYCQTSSFPADIVSYCQTLSVTVRHRQLPSNIASSHKTLSLVGGFGFNGPLRRYFCLCPAVSQRGRKKRGKIDEQKHGQTSPTRTYCKRNRPLPYY